ncbi:hypothetical protein E2562_013482 [Oryza meyeriana var. granulata]|uniref:Uncharacterized protein n=1 Tax=Oryza meyeriana var. granulata TaxID=110450 RepID=A0A6G1BWC6_9ORYZ|nr:hypothetical protein E2562_013482 [Oryza meyeriana var. granulata]
MRAVSICAYFLISALLLLHCFLSLQTARVPNDDRASIERFQSRKLLQDVLITSSENAKVFHAAALVHNMSKKKPDVEEAESLKKETPSKANPIQN